MAIFKKNTRIGVIKKEVAGTEGTVPSPAFVAADYDVRMRELELSSLTVEMDDEASKFATGDHTMDEAIPGIKKAEISFKIKMAPGELDTTVTANSKLAYQKVFETAGLIGSYAGDLVTPGVYSFVPGMAADTTTATVAIVDIESGVSPKGIEYKIAGAMSTLEIGCEGTGKPFTATLKYQGKVESVEQLETVPVYSDVDGMQTLGDKFLGTDIRITPVNVNTGLPEGTPIDFCSNSFTADSGISLASIECQKDASGIQSETVTARNPSVKINPRLLKIAAWDFWSELNDVTLYQVEVLGTNVQYTAFRCQLMSTTIGDDNGFFRNELVFRPLRNIGDGNKEETYRIDIADVDITPAP